jgi:xylose isomerase
VVPGAVLTSTPFGAGNARGAFWVVDALLAGGYDGPVHFDYKPPRTEDDDGVWESARACMRNYLILRDKARAFRADPEVTAALAASGVPDLAVPTLAHGESWRDVRDVTIDADAVGARGMGYERLDQLALEHLYGIR